MLDILVALIILILSSPFLILTTLCLAFANSGSPFFLQQRPGFKEKIFTIIKFKTMNDRKDSEGKLLSDDIRITNVGKLVRKLSLDEFPQMVNVLKGEMSLIGPRPLLVEYLPLYNESQARRHSVRPGITGWAQVNGRNTLSWEKKFEYDVWYVDNLSFLLDVKILFLTVVNVLKRKGISSETSQTMEKFTGEIQ